jgi:hypothetical protein
MAVSRFSNSTIANGFPKYQRFWDQSSAELTGAFESIATITLTSAQAALEFTGIPQTYKHLQLRGLFRSDYSGQGAGGYLEFNGNASGTYRAHALYMNGAGAVGSYDSGALSVGTYWGVDTAGLSPANTFGVQIADILDYTNTNKNRVVKIYSGRSVNNSNSTNQLNGGLYASTTPITSLKIKFGGAAQWAAGTTVALYGIKG